MENPRGTGCTMLSVNEGNRKKAKDFGVWGIPAIDPVFIFVHTLLISKFHTATVPAILHFSTQHE